MKLKIQKGDETKSFNLINSWADITLESWSKLIAINTKESSTEALATIGALTDMPQRIIRELGIQDVAIILKRIAVMQKKESTTLVKIIKVDGKEYGFHPNLDDMTLGEYADIETLIKGDLSEVLPDIMAILFRPIVEKVNNVYSIEAYDGNIGIRREKFKQMKGEQVQAALVFFYRFGKVSMRSIQLFLMELTTETIQKIQETSLEISGDGSELSTDLQTEKLSTLQK